MNWVDFAILGIISVSTVISLFRGFVREFLSLTAWLLAFWVALQCLEPVSALLSDAISSAQVRKALAFIGVFVMTLFGCGLINQLVGRLVGKTGLSGMDRLLGGLFGLFRGLAVVIVVVQVARLTPLPDMAWWQQSQIVPTVEIVIREIVSWLQPGSTKDFGY